MELQRRQQEHLLQQQQKLQELQVQLSTQYANSGAVGPQGLMFLPFLEQLRGLQPGGIPPNVAKAALTNHVSFLCLFVCVRVNFGSDAEITVIINWKQLGFIAKRENAVYQKHKKFIK